MIKKVCFKCNTEKVLKEFYKHKYMADGHLNKCKKCTIKDSSERTKIITSTTEGLEKERARHREKYKRLNYREKQKIWDKDKPWKKSSTYKNLRRKYKAPKSFELHHWNYNDKYLEDVLLMTKSEHRKLHKLIELDIDKRIFKDKKTGKYLNSKVQHCGCIIHYGFNYLEPKK